MGITAKILLAGVVAAAVILLRAPAASAQPVPRVTAFVHDDSLAVAVDCERLITDRRMQRLSDGYPLSFYIRLNLMRAVPLWADQKLKSIDADFRIAFRKWDSKYELVLKDFDGQPIRESHQNLDGVLISLEDHLLVTVMPLISLDSSAQYFFEIEAGYRNLTFEDVQSAEKWLRDGSRPDSLDSEAASGETFGSRILRFIWDMAGPGSEKTESRTDIFRLPQLRSSD